MTESDIFELVKNYLYNQTEEWLYDLVCDYGRGKTDEFHRLMETHNITYITENPRDYEYTMYIRIGNRYLAVNGLSDEYSRFYDCSVNETFPKVKASVKWSKYKEGDTKTSYETKQALEFVQ